MQVRAFERFSPYRLLLINSVMEFVNKISQWSIMFIKG